VTENEVRLRNIPWYKDLVDYFNVSPEQALELGTRKPNRKPDLPGSKTCEPVSGLTHEDIWEARERKTQEDIFSFYQEQGSWSCFRQVVRHADENLIRQHISATLPFLKAGFHFVEYGCGVAPYTITLLKFLAANVPKIDLTISISDVECEHLRFAEWRIKRMIEEQGLVNIKFNVETILPNELPKYEKEINHFIIFEVLEHVPSPINAITNAYEQLAEDGTVVENFILHVDEEAEDDGPDLMSARLERTKYYEFLVEKFDFLKDGNLETTEHLKQFPNNTRTWKKK